MAVSFEIAVKMERRLLFFRSLVCVCICLGERKREKEGESGREGGRDRLRE